jgi:hypothetical protein
MDCPACGALIAEGQAFCPSCSEPVRQPGLISRLWTRLRAALADPAPIVAMQRAEQIQVVDPKTGERKVYQSLAEMPAETRAALEAALGGTSLPAVLDAAAIERLAREAAARGVPGDLVKCQVFTHRDASGREHTYQSLEEMPPEVRAIFEKAVGDARIRLGVGNQERPAGE